MPRDDHTANSIETWLKDNRISDVEILTSDFAGISRGKIMPVSKFLSGLENRGHRMPESVLGLGINCGFSFNEYITELEKDLFLVPDLDTLRVVPWLETPTACVICDPLKDTGEASNIAPRQVLRNVVNAYAKKGWKPLVAPEFEFYLIAKQDKIESEPLPPRGLSGKVAWDTGELSLTGLEEFSTVFSDINKFCDIMNIEIDTLTHEAGPAQFEVNIQHDDPMTVADQSFMFKRLVRRTAIRHDMFATFMAKPYPEHYGSAMHIHQSVVDNKTGINIFADDEAQDTELFMSYIAGLQTYIPGVMPLLAPYANSYLRINDDIDAPVNTHWGRENRTVGLRVPAGGRNSRRVENRIPGADVNPYLAIAATLAAGYLGMVNKLEPSESFDQSAYKLSSRRLPQHPFAARDRMTEMEDIAEILTPEFTTTFLDVKREEYRANMDALSPWEIRYLLLNV